jgi:predicted dienelactone hydrolase
MNKDYNPFIRGSFPVGVISQDLHDSSRKRTFPTEIWYPATNEYHGQDLSEETKDKYSLLNFSLTQDAVRAAKLREGTFPLIIFSHGFGGERRMSAHLCCHLASHGYVVVSPDHTGNTALDILSYGNKSEQEIMKITTQAFVNRPRDISFLINCMLNNKTSISSEAIEGDHIGVSGHSAGGWTILMAIPYNEGISAVVPLAPGGGYSKEFLDGKPLADALNLNWECEVPTLFLAADKDVQVPIDSIYDLFNRTHEPKSLVILKNADHPHFFKDIEDAHEWMRSQPEMVFGDSPITKRIKENMLPFSELCSEKNAHDFVCGLELAHMDTHLKNNINAKEWLQGDIKAIMAKRGIDVSVPEKSEIVI